MSFFEERGGICTKDLPSDESNIDYYGGAKVSRNQVYMFDVQRKSMWLIFAFGSAFFAALTAILAKIGLDGVNSTLATAIRCVVILVLAWAMVFIAGAQSGIADISTKSWVFLILSGVATGLSWLCYFKALQMGDATQVVAIDKLSVVITFVLAFLILHEPMGLKTILAALLITGGSLLLVF